MSPLNSPREYPIACPECDRVKGYPYQVRTLAAAHHGSIEVKLRCRECNHEWIEVVDNAD
jgi:hypothetical protein